jgi:hypothetical protein
VMVPTCYSPIRDGWGQQRRGAMRCGSNFDA